MIQIILLVCTVLTLLATILPLSWHSHWMVRGFDFPRLQITFFSAGLMIALLVFLDWQQPLTLLMLGTTTLCFAWQLWWILPYTPVWPIEVKSATSLDPGRILSIITANVLTTNRNARALINQVQTHQPDILVTLESDQWWQDQLQELETTMPHTVKCPLDNLYGMHLYSTLPLHDAEVAFLVEKDVPSIHVTIELQTGDLVKAHFLHPAPPSPTENTRSVERDVELIVVARSVAAHSQPVIVTGDLNDVAWSATTRLFRKISGLLDPRIGRGMYNTFHADYPIMRWPLDHLFHSHHFTLNSIQRLSSIGSDHFPLYTSLVFAPAKGMDQQGLEADSDDKQRAEAIVRKRGRSAT